MLDVPCLSTGPALLLPLLSQVEEKHVLKKRQLKYKKLR